MRDIAGKNRDNAEAFKAKKIEVVELDVTSTKSVDGAVSEIVSRADRVDVVVNNAGVATSGVSEAPDRRRSSPSVRRERRVKTE
jgi:NAD(P)-dependent dehydrogenase (short-subunit alcohol dehydrogenase family)